MAPAPAGRHLIFLFLENPDGFQPPRKVLAFIYNHLNQKLLHESSSNAGLVLVYSGPVYP
jgi:hypothetical protein